MASAKQIKRVRDEVAQLRPTIQNTWAGDAVREQITWLTTTERALGAFYYMAFPLSLWAVWGLLAWLTLLGILWPMSALPGIPGSVGYSRNLILWVFGGGVGGFELFLLSELIRLL
jgi:hypothetical protein